MKSDLESSVVVVKFRILRALFLFSFCLSAIFFFIVGGIFLIFFHAAGYESWLVRATVVLSSVSLPFIGSIVFAFQKVPDRKKLVALLDKNTPKNGGLMVAKEEIDIGAWKNAISGSNPPTVSLDLSRKVAALFVAVLFLLSSLFVPSFMPETRVVHKMEVGQHTNEMKKEIEFLKEENILSELEAKQWEEQLDQLTDTATGENPEKTWEALDHLKHGIHEKVSSVGQEAAIETLKMDSLRQICETLQENAEKCGTGDMKAALEGLNELLKNMIKKDPKLKELLGQACSEGMTLDKLAKLTQLCDANCEQLKKMLERLRKCGLLKKDCSIGCEGNKGKDGDEALLAFLKQNCSSSACEKLALCLYIPQPGEGGVNRGPGTAPISWHDRDMTFKGRFKDETIFSRDITPKDSVLMATSAAAPETGDSRKVTTGHLKSENIRPSNDMSFVIHPRHQRSVKKYFSREKK